MRTAGSPADGPAAGAGSGRARRRRWYLVGHLIIAAWLVAALAVSLTRPVVPHAHWLLVHAPLMGAASTAILIWSEHFALALLPRADDVGGRRRMARLGAFTTGAVLVTAGIAVPSWAAVDVGSV